eukprot:g29971.t1
MSPIILVSHGAEKTKPRGPPCSSVFTQLSTVTAAQSTQKFHDSFGKSALGQSFQLSMFISIFFLPCVDDER